MCHINKTFYLIIVKVFFFLVSFSLSLMSFQKIYPTILHHTAGRGDVEELSLLLSSEAREYLNSINGFGVRKKREKREKRRREKEL